MLEAAVCLSRCLQEHPRNRPEDAVYFRAVRQHCACITYRLLASLDNSSPEKTRMLIAKVLAQCLVSEDSGCLSDVISPRRALSDAAESCLLDTYRMIHEGGPPAVFLAMSPLDILWSELYDVRVYVLLRMTLIIRCSCLRNPITRLCSQFCTQRCRPNTRVSLNRFSIFWRVAV